MAPTLTPAEHELWRLTMEHSPVGMALMSPDGRYLRVNPAFCQMVGYDREALVGLSFHHITHPDDLGEDLGLVRGLLEGRYPSYRMDKRYIRKNGSIASAHLTVSLAHGADGQPRHFIAQVEDFRPDLVVLDTSGTVIAVNPLDNPAVTEVYERTLNPVCDRVGAALLYTHHHRKGGASGNMREAALGAVAWENQADFVVAVKAVKGYSETPLEGGHVQTKSTFVMRWPKGRGGLIDAPFAYEIHGEKDAPAPKGATLSLELRLPTAELTDAEQIAAVVEGETARKAIAEALPWGGGGTGTKFRDALKAAEDQQLIFKVSKGIYSDTPKEAAE